MSEKNVILISKDYIDSNFQSKLTEANEGDNIKITGEGDNLKISATGNSFKYISEYEDASGSWLDLGGYGSAAPDNMIARSYNTRICGGNDTSDMWDR